MKHASLFSGIGGFDLAAEWAGWDNIFHCEWNPFGQKVLKYHFPKSISYNDITKTDFNIYRGRIDVLTGGFPCQPYSTAGLRKGKEDNRHLWPEMLRAIREIQPRWVVGENVRGLVNWGGGMVFEEVQADLEKQGYEVQPFIIPAAGVNAPHQRYRIWFVAYSNTTRVHEQHIATESNQKTKSSRISFEKRDFSAFPTKPSICGGNDGIPRELDGITFSKWRKESIKAYGNAIVPQVAFEIFKTINTFESIENNI
jgi:DNA (cytosine-5)-methyltransferase 1